MFGQLSAISRIVQNAVWLISGKGSEIKSKNTANWDHLPDQWEAPCGSRRAFCHEKWSWWWSFRFSYHLQGTCAMSSRTRTRTQHNHLTQNSTTKTEASTTNSRNMNIITLKHLYAFIGSTELVYNLPICYAIYLARQCKCSLLSSPSSLHEFCCQLCNILPSQQSPFCQTFDCEVHSS